VVADRVGHLIDATKTPKSAYSGKSPRSKPNWQSAMPRSPKGEKRPADVIGNAVKVMQIATGEIEETPNTPRTATLPR
jgi:hypothetical protein